MAAQRRTARAARRANRGRPAAPVGLEGGDIVLTVPEGTEDDLSLPMITVARLLDQAAEAVRRRATTVDEAGAVVDAVASQVRYLFAERLRVMSSASTPGSGPTADRPGHPGGAQLDQP